MLSASIAPLNQGERDDLIYIDCVRNSIGQALVAPYSLRAFPNATVSTPVEWRELTKGVLPTRFTFRITFRRVNGKGDVWKSAFRSSTTCHTFKSVWSRWPTKPTTQRVALPSAQNTESAAAATVSVAVIRADTHVTR